MHKTSKKLIENAQRGSKNKTGDFSNKLEYLKNCWGNFFKKKLRIKKQKVFRNKFGDTYKKCN